MTGLLHSYWNCYSRSTVERAWLHFKFQLLKKLKMCTIAKPWTILGNDLSFICWTAQSIVVLKNYFHVSTVHLLKVGNCCIHIYYLVATSVQLHINTLYAVSLQSCHQCKVMVIINEYKSLIVYISIANAEWY